MKSKSKKYSPGDVVILKHVRSSESINYDIARLKQYISGWRKGAWSTHNDGGGIYEDEIVRHATEKDKLMLLLK